MKKYQDTETGGIHEFEDGYDPLTANNRNIPRTLTVEIKPKPDDSHVWYQGGWIKQEDAPTGYTPPVSRVPAYNPAWMAYLRPYTAVYRTASSGLSFTLDQINANTYDGSKLAEVVATLPLGNSSDIPALISYDGAIAIPQCPDYPTNGEGTRKLNEVLCSFLIGGIYTEAVHSEDLVVGTLHEKTSLFSFSPSLHSSLRLNWAAPVDRRHLMFPRVLMLDDLQKAFAQGQQVVSVLGRFSPLFLLSGFTAMTYRNNSDALNNLWITVEQLTEHLWIEQYKRKKSELPAYVAKAHTKLSERIRHIASKQKLLCLSRIISKECYRVLVRARKQRNALAHRGVVPDLQLIERLWGVLPELLETASGVAPLGLRAISANGASVERWYIPPRTDFSEWVDLAQALAPDA
ncbi:MAG: hypothetical protein KGL40_00770 [Rhodocyclaceae bacterium]|nr:hypothetical protein [Rhodocyclaceae bacterium]